MSYIKLLDIRLIYKNKKIAFMNTVSEAKLENRILKIYHFQ